MANNNNRNNLRSFTVDLEINYESGKSVRHEGVIINIAVYNNIYSKINNIKSYVEDLFDNYKSISFEKLNGEILIINTKQVECILITNIKD